MRITEQLRKPLKEANYLNVENTERYRPILRLFYLKYERMKYWLYQEDVYEELRQDPFFADYTMEQCQQDLTALEGWGNLITIQDSKNVKTLEEFKNRRYQYQLSEYTVEIERMVIHLENLSVEGASLEPTLLERIREELSRLSEMQEASVDKTYGWWQNLENDFVRLNQNYQDYMRALNSARAEELMRTKEFLVFKDHLIEYLRTFVKALQVNVTVIESYMKQVKEEQIEAIVGKIVEYEMNIPRIEVQADPELIRERTIGKWTSIEEWFVGRAKTKNSDTPDRAFLETAGRESEAVRVFDATNEIIRKITRYATRLSERSNMGANRREEYDKVAQMFVKCRDINAAHRLAACVFGIETALHMKGDMPRETDSINSGVFDEPPHYVKLKPRVRNYREKASRSGIVDRSEEQERIRREMMEQIEREREMLDGYIKDGTLNFASLPVIEPQIRDVFLVWLSKALEREDETAKTEDGRTYHLAGNREETCVVRCTDGDFTMPAFTICFDD